MQESIDLVKALREKTREIGALYDDAISRIETSPGGFDDPKNQEKYCVFLDSIKGMENEKIELQRVADAVWERDHVDEHSRYIYDVTMGGSMIAIIAAMNEDDLFKILVSMPRSPFQFIPPNFKWKKIGLALPSLHGFVNYLKRTRFTTRSKVVGCDYCGSTR